MRAGAVSGRVGALAVVVGVGVAAASGVASAGTDGADSAGPSGGPPASAEPATGGTKPEKTGSDTAKTADKPAKKSEQKPRDQRTEKSWKKSLKPRDSDRPIGPNAEATGGGGARGADQTPSAATGAKPAPTAPAKPTPTAKPTPPAKPVVPALTKAAPAAPTAVKEPVEASTAPQPGDTKPAPTPVVDPKVPAPAARSAALPPAPRAVTPTTISAKKAVALPVRPAAPTRRSALEKLAEKAVTREKVSVAPTAAVEKVAVPTAASAVTSVVVTTRAAVQESGDTKPSSGGVLQTIQATAQKVVAGIAGVMGLAPAANAPSTPSTPSGLAALVALLGWGSRRETSITPPSVPATPVATAVDVTPLAAVSAPATIRVGWLTGENSINQTKTRFDIYGTDLGIMWDNGVTGDNPSTAIVEQRQILIAFGDTFNGPNQTGTWRNNVLLRSADNVLSDGLYIPNGIIHDPGAYSGAPMTYQNVAREIIGKYPYSKATQVTIIPTGAVSVEGAGANGATRQYVAFMSIKSWDSPGKWTTNYSAISYSDDNGQNWTVVPASSVRAPASGRSTVAYQSGNENFQMINFVKPPEGSADAAAGYVYAYGTPAGRNGTVYLSRVNETQILDTSKYDYWDGKTWVRNKPSSAKPVLPGTTTSSFFGLIKKTTYPTAGELSVQYNSYLKKYVMLSTDSSNNVVMRTADSPTGTWSKPTTLATSANYPGLYAPMIHPWSGTDQLKKTDGSPEDPQYLYWNMSVWGDYNVALMRTDLSRV